MSSKIVDSEELVQDLITTIVSRLQSLMFLDLEGVNLSRHGTISIIQILLPPDPTVYLVDVHVLGDRSLSTSVAGNTLRSIMESKDRAKVFFDVRNDSDAIFHQFGVRLRAVIDIQVIEFISRPDQGRFVKGLAKCVDEENICLPHDPDKWEAEKIRGRELFVPELGGSYEVFLQRPIRKEIIDYCVSDVLIMPAILAIYGKRLDAGLCSQVQRLTDERVRWSQSPSFKGKGRHMARGPDLTRLRSDARDTIFPMTLICSTDLESLCHVDGLPESEQRKLTRGLDIIQQLMTGDFAQRWENLISGLDAQGGGATTCSVEETEGERSLIGHGPGSSHDIEADGSLGFRLMDEDRKSEHVQPARNKDSATHQENQMANPPLIHAGGESSGTRANYERSQSVNTQLESKDDMNDFIEHLSSHDMDDADDVDDIYEHPAYSDRYYSDSEESMKDFTACDRECGYCGHCMY